MYFGPVNWKGSCEDRDASGRVKAQCTHCTTIISGNDIDTVDETNSPTKKLRQNCFPFLTLLLHQESFMILQYLSVPA